VRRGGYDPGTVNARVQQLLQANGQGQSALRNAQRRIAELERKVTDLKASATQGNEAPSYASLGGRASAMLRLAEEEAAAVKESAEKEAAVIREAAQREAAATKASAQRDIEALRTTHYKEIDDHREKVTSEVQQARKMVQAESDEPLAAAKREADQIRLAVQQEVTQLRTSTQREVEKARAGADREVQEARRMLAVERERLAREAADHHDQAMAETTRIVTEGETRAADAEERARIAAQHVADQRAELAKESEGIVARARRDAEAILSKARAEADHLASTATVEAEKGHAIIKAEVDRLTKRRDAIAAQLSSLTDLVSGFGKTEDPAELEAPKPITEDEDIVDGELVVDESVTLVDSDDDLADDYDDYDEPSEKTAIREPETATESR
jgi:cell division septum initiation protein DivIVA